MQKENLFLVLSGSVTVVISTLYLHFFGFENSLFRVKVPRYSGASWVKPPRVLKEEIFNNFMAFFDWVILIATAIIVLLIVGKVIKALIVSLFHRKYPFS